MFLGCLDCECLFPDLYYSRDFFVAVYEAPCAAGCQPCEGCKDPDTTQQSKGRGSLISLSVTQLEFGSTTFEFFLNNTNLTFLAFLHKIDISGK